MITIPPKQVDIWLRFLCPKCNSLGDSYSYEELKKQKIPNVRCIFCGLRSKIRIDVADIIPVTNVIKNSLSHRVSQSLTVLGYEAEEKVIQLICDQYPGYTVGQIVKECILAIESARV